MKLWVTEWRNAGIPENIIREFYDKYGVPTPELTEALINDDRMIGIGKLTLPYSNDEIIQHDIRMLLSKLGWPISSAVQIQTDFAADTLERGAKGLAFATVAIPIAVVGSVVGGAIMIYRALQ